MELHERPDAPRSAVTEAKLKQSTPEKESLGGCAPKGFVNLALLKGYRLGFESSSDHISTHLSFANVLISGEPTRKAILNAIHKRRRVYGATGATSSSASAPERSPTILQTNFGGFVFVITRKLGRVYRYNSGGRERLSPLTRHVGT